MTEQKIEIRPVRCNPLPVVVERVDGLIWQRDSANRLTPAVIAVLILVYVIPKVEHVVDRVLPCWVAKRVEEAEREVGAAIDGKANLGDYVIGSRSGLGPADWAVHV